MRSEAGELTPDQRVRMAENRAAALERRVARLSAQVGGSSGRAATVAMADASTSIDRELLYAKTHSRAAGAKRGRRKAPRHPDVTELQFPSGEVRRMAAKLATVADALLEAVAGAADGAWLRQPADPRASQRHRDSSTCQALGRRFAHFLPPAIPSYNRRDQSYEHFEHPTTISPTRVRPTSIVLTSMYY